MASCQNYYYSGQGRVFVAARKADGTPQGFRQIGNVPSLEISIDVTKFEHKESCTGSRAIDLTIVQEKNGTFSMTMESISSKNLALAAWGTNALVAGAAVTGESIAVDDATLRYRLGGVNLDDSVAVTLTNQYTAAVTTWAATTAYAVGDSVEPTVSNGRVYYVAATADAGTSDASEPMWPTVAGDIVADATVTWTDAGLQSLAETTDFTLDAEYGMVDFLDANDVGLVSYESAYTHLGYLNVDALTETSQERWLRFEGLNTIDGQAVVLDLFRASIDPLQGYALINEEIASIDLSGNILLDANRPTGDQFFQQRYVSTAANI
jgi:hypothetical protein